MFVQMTKTFYSTTVQRQTSIIICNNLISLGDSNDNVFRPNHIELPRYYFRSLLKVQRMIVTGSQALEYFMNNKFIFIARNYNAALDKLNEIDKSIFYGRSTVNFNSYSDFVVQIRIF